MDEDELLYELCEAYEGMLEDNPEEWMEDQDREVCGVYFVE